MGEPGLHVVDQRGLARAFFDFASSTVSPRTMPTENITLQWSGLRPCPAMRLRTSSRWSFACSTRGPRPRWCRHAWRRTCDSLRKSSLADYRPTLRAGRHVERSARLEVLADEIDGMDLAEIGIHAVSGSATTASGSQDCHSLSTTWIHSSAIS